MLFWMLVLALILHQVPERWFPWVVGALIFGVLIFCCYLDHL
jgi:hypothetical protein